MAKGGLAGVERWVLGMKVLRDYANGDEGVTELKEWEVVGIRQIETRGQESRKRVMTERGRNGHCEQYHYSEYLNEHFLYILKGGIVITLLR